MLFINDGCNEAHFARFVCADRFGKKKLLSCTRVASGERHEEGGAESRRAGERNGRDAEEGAVACVDEIAPKQNRKGFAYARARNLRNDGLREALKRVKAPVHRLVDHFRRLEAFFKVGACREDVFAAFEQNDSHFGIVGSRVEQVGDLAEHIAGNRVAAGRTADGQTKDAVLDSGNDAHGRYRCVKKEMEKAPEADLQRAPKVRAPL